MTPRQIPARGRVVRLSYHEGYGCVETADRLEVYFDEDSVLGGRFADLQVGDEVLLEVAGQESDKGPRATTVRRIARHHPIA